MHALRSLNSGPTSSRGCFSSKKKSLNFFPSLCQKPTETAGWKKTSHQKNVLDLKLKKEDVIHIFTKNYEKGA